MSTNDPEARDASAWTPAGEAPGTEAWEGISAAMASLNDPAVISRLASEFFAALPNAQVLPDALKASAPTRSLERDSLLGVPVAPSGAVSELPLSTRSDLQQLAQAPSSARVGAAPGSSFYFLETLRPAPRVDDMPLPAGVSAPASAEFVPAPDTHQPAVPNNPVGATAVPVQAADHFPGSVGDESSFYFLDEETARPASAPPTDLPSSAMFSLPGVPLAEPPQPAPSSPVAAPTGIPTEADLEHHPDSSAPATLVLPEHSASVPQAVGPSDVSAPTDNPNAALPSEVRLRELPGEVAEKSTPATEADIRRPANANEPYYFLEAMKIDPLDRSPLPPASELFSLPGLPGTRSLPGAPAMPLSPPETAPSQTDLRAQTAPVAGAPTAPSTSIASPAMAPYVPPYFYNQEKPELPGTPPSSVVEFQSGMLPKLDLAPTLFDPRSIRRDFPILQERVHGKPLVWLDNAATTQKPSAVIDRLTYFYRHENSNIHRAAHTLAARATDAYESAREKTRRFLNASSTREIIFVRGATEGINLVAKSWGHRYVEKGDEVVITWLEHHANIVPWQQLCAEKGARLRVAPVNDRGELILEEYEKLLNPRTRLVAFSHVSNALGTITPAKSIIDIAHRHGALVLLDGAQSVSHMRENVQALDCDFFVFSGHKIFAPTGIGVVYGKVGLLDATPPWQGGGNMIQDVTFEKTTYHPAPARFEAGTGNIADAVGLGAALDYLDQVGLENVIRYEHELLNYATAGLTTVPGLRIIGAAREKAGVLSFVLDGFRTEDVGKALDEEGIAVRSGHHCAQPILRRFGLESTVRASLALYNTCEDIDALVAALLRIQAGRGHRGL